MALLSDPNWRLTCTRHLVEALGFKLELDLDSDLLISPPPTINVEDVTRLLIACSNALAYEIDSDAKRQRRQFVGGPFNGQKHRSLGWAHWLAKRVKRGKWAAYYMPDPDFDGRAFYVGEAPSERKARALAYDRGPKLNLSPQTDE